MTTLMVTPFAPYRDGIGTYAAQEIRHRRDLGEAIDVVSPLPSAAHHHLPLGTVRGAAMLVNLARSYDRVVVQFGPELLLGRCRTAAQRTAVWSSLATLARLVPVELRIHEIEYQPMADNGAERRLLRLLFGLADQVTVHTEPERELLQPLVGDAAANQITVIDHGHHFVPAVSCTPEEAKAELGLLPDEFVFLSIGFIQRHKGFDRSAEAFSLAQLPNARLHIVGSGRIDHPQIGAYVAELAELCRQSETIELHNRFVSDDQFDLWLQAADAVVLPYREIWSSSVVERARLFGKPIITSDLEQLRHQLGDDGFACPDVGEMAVAMEKVWSGSPSARLASDVASPRRRASDRKKMVAWNVDDTEPDQAAIQAQIVHRAKRQNVVMPPSSTQISIAGSAGRRTAMVGGSRPSNRLTTLGPVERPEATSARPGVAPIKQVVDRLTGWQVSPMRQHIAKLQQATLEAIVEVESQIEALSSSDERNEADTPMDSSAGGENA